jgi:GntR family transcriptional regulator
MPLWIHINTGSGEAIYLQVIRQISQAIAMGRLLPGDRLPPVRKLAQELVVNPNTIAKAYAALEQQNLVVTRTGSGTFVSDASQGSVSGDDMNVLNERIDNIIAHSINSGLTPEQILDVFAGRLRKFENKDKGDSQNE